MRIEELLRSEPLQAFKPAPVDQWSPSIHGEIDIVIKADGTWWHEGGQIKRMGLVRLLASVLTRDQGDYVLRTPAEQMRIKVEASPFLLVDYQFDPQQGFYWLSNIGERFLWQQQKNYWSQRRQQSIIEHRRLDFALHRNLYYQCCLDNDNLLVIDHEYFWQIDTNHRLALGKI